MTTVVSHGPDECPDCGGEVQHNGGAVCRDCSAVLDDQPIDHGPDWGIAENGERSKARASPGDTPRMHSPLGTAPPIGGNITARHQKWEKQSRCPTKADRKIMGGLNDTQRLASTLDLPGSIIDRACALYSRAHREGRVQGRVIEAYAGAAVVIAARENRLPITVEDVLRLSRLEEEKKVWNALRDLGCNWDVDVLPPGPTVFARRVCHDLELDHHLRPEVERICKIAEQEEVHIGRDPLTVATAAAYHVDMSVSYPDASEVGQCSSHSLRNVLKECSATDPPRSN